MNKENKDSVCSFLVYLGIFISGYLFGKMVEIELYGLSVISISFIILISLFMVYLYLGLRIK